MPTDIFEGSAIALTAKANSDYTGKTARFEIQQDGKGTKVASTTANFTFLTARYDIAKLPNVHDDDESYLLEYKVTVEGVTRLSNSSWKVWPKMYEIEAVTDDGKEGKFCEFDVGGGDNRGLVQLNSSGKGNYEPGSPCGSPTFTIRSPYELVTWDKATGRKRKATVKRKPYTAEFFEPAYADIPSGLKFTSTAVTSKQGFWQVVNLDGSEASYYGTSIKFKVGAAGDKSRSGSAKYGKKDDLIHVKVEFDSANSRRNDDPKPGVIQKSGDPLVESTTATQTFTVKLGEEGTPGEFEVFVGAAGGDKIKVSIGVTSACQDAQYEIITDRRVFYQVTRNAGQENPDLARSSAALGKVGVSLSLYKVLSLQPTDKPSGCVSWVDGAYFDEKAAKLNVGNYNSTFYHGKWSKTDGKTKEVSPRLHVLYTDLQYDSYDPAVTNADADKLDIGGQKLKNTDLVVWSDKTNVVGLKFDFKVSSMGLFDKRLYNEASPFVSGTWVDMVSGTTGPFSAGDIWIAPKCLTIKLPAACKIYLDAGNEVGIVNIRLARARGPYLGEAFDRKILCVVTQTTQQINDTLTHEVGHVIGLVPDSTAPPGLTLTDHTRRYTQNQHQGGHCAKGMSDDNYASGTGKVSTAYHLNFRGKAECTCVMYGEGSGSSTGEYCDLCVPFAKAGKIV